MEIMIMGKVHGAEKVERMLSNVSPQLRNALLMWLYNEKTRFIGTKTREGFIKRYIRTQTYAGTWSTGRQWRTQVMNLFNGKVIDPISGQVVTPKKIRAGLFSGVRGGGTGAGITGTGVSMNLKMGVLYNNRKKIHEALEALEEPHTVNSNKYMPIPVSGAGLSKPYQKFQSWYKAGMFTVIYKNGLAFYFLNSAKGVLRSEKEQHGKLMFIGRKTVNIKFAHHFTKHFNSMQPAMINRGRITVDRTVDELKKV